MQDYIDSMEGATKSGLLCADAVLRDAALIRQSLGKEGQQAAAMA